MSTLTGTANFALERIPEEYQDTCSIAIGSVNILAGIITTVAQFLKLNELSSMVCWLSSDENSFSTAAVFDISGGRSTY